jgi:hypothetical protein
VLLNSTIGPGCKWFIRCPWGNWTDPVKLSGAHAWPSEVFKTRTCACGPDTLGGSAIGWYRSRIKYIQSHTYFQNKSFGFEKPIFN